MKDSEVLFETISRTPRRWLVTGSAGFIGSHLLETLLQLNQTVVSLDNFSTGYRRNLDEVRQIVGAEAWSRHQFIEGDITDLDVCRQACNNVNVILHEAALGSVPRSLEDPLNSNASNVTGFLNMLIAARDAHVDRFIYAASSSSYGDHPGIPKVEHLVGSPLSPYAVTKYVNELYADVFAKCYGLNSIGLRYFNVFGPRQDPDGAYAAVIPRWVQAMLRREQVVIYGDGETSRDFCFITNVVQANLLAATTVRSEAVNQVYNVAVGRRTSLKELFDALRILIAEHDSGGKIPDARYDRFRPGDVRHSLASIDKARDLLGFSPTHDVNNGLKEALPWYLSRLG